MGTRDKIRNRSAYERSQEKKCLAFEKKVTVAMRRLIKTLDMHFDGKLVAGTKDEAIDCLIEKGTLGSMESSRRIARTLKHRQQQRHELTRDDRYRRDDAAQIIDTALDRLQANGELTITVSKRQAVIVTAAVAAVELDDTVVLSSATM